MASLNLCEVKEFIEKVEFPPATLTRDTTSVCGPDLTIVGRRMWTHGGRAMLRVTFTFSSPQPFERFDTLLRNSDGSLAGHNAKLVRAEEPFTYYGTYSDIDGTGTYKIEVVLPEPEHAKFKDLSRQDLIQWIADLEGDLEKAQAEHEKDLAELTGMANTATGDEPLLEPELEPPAESDLAPPAVFGHPPN